MSLAARGRLRPTAAAWRLSLIGFGLLAAAVNTGNNLIYLTFSLLLAAVFVSVGVAVVNSRRPRLALRLPSAPVVGAPFTIDLDAANERRWFATRAIEFTLLTDQGEHGPLFVERIDPGKSVRLTYPARGARRGPLRIHGAVLRSTYPLGLVERLAVHELVGETLVLPRMQGAELLPPTTAEESGRSTASPRVAGTEYQGLRRGNLEDDARKVDWKVTARRGVVMVRETAGESRREVSLSLSTRSSGDPETLRRRFEQRVTRLASVARRTLLDDGVVHLAIDEEGARTYASRNDLLGLLRRLAACEPTAPDGTPIPRPAASIRPAGSGSDSPAATRSSAPGRAHRYSALAAISISSVALFAFGAIGTLSFTVLAASLLATAMTTRFIAGERTVTGRLWQAAAVGSLLFFLAEVLWLGQDLLSAASHLLVFVTLLAVFNARKAEDDRKLLLISFVHMVLAAALTTELAFALPLLAWTFAAVHALIAFAALPASGRPSRLGSLLEPRARRLRYAVPASALTPAVLAVGAAVFLLVPHLGTGTFRPTTLRPQRVSGFSDSARLGDIGRIKLDDSKVMEVEIGGARVANDELKWRGVVLSSFDGRSWTRGRPYLSRVATDDEGRLLPSGGEGESIDVPRSGSLTQEIRLEPADTHLIFAAARPREVTSRDFRRLAEDGSGNLEFFRKPGRRLSYTVVSDPPPTDPEVLRRANGADSPDALSPNLELPRLDGRIPALAREITAGTTTRYDAARAIESWLQTRREYSLDVNDSGVADPLARFLLDGAPGHCEYFATSMVVMARSSGIPSRFVAGYLRGEKSRFGRRYVVRQSDAHSWVEVHFPGHGWVAFDPTPPAGRAVSEARGVADLASFLYSSVTRLWDDYVVGIDLDDQARTALALFNGVRDKLAAVASWPWLRLTGATAVIALIVVALRALRRSPGRRGPGRTDAARNPAVPSFYTQFLALLDSRGLRRQPNETAGELLERARSRVGPRGAERMRELTRLYYGVRFDSAAGGAPVHRIARALLDDVRAELRDDLTAVRPS